MEVLIPGIAAFAIADVDRATAIPAAPMIDPTFAIPAIFPPKHYTAASTS
jgi:hypothetical protein